MTAAAVGVQADYTLADLHRIAHRSDYAAQVRRLSAVALILDSRSGSDATNVVGVTLQIAREKLLLLNEERPDGSATRKVPGRTSILNDEQRARRAETVKAGPISPTHGVVSWRLCGLVQWLWD